MPSPQVWDGHEASRVHHALGGAAALPLAARAQQVMPVIGFLASSSADAPSGPIAAIHLGLKQAGYEVGQTVRMEYRYANNQLERLPALAAELVKISRRSHRDLRRSQAYAGGEGGDHDDPDRVRAGPRTRSALGLVASLNRPGGNITGVAALTIELDPKRLELLHELTPPAVRSACC